MGRNAVIAFAVHSSPIPPIQPMMATD
jgi:hypothetical protein